MSASMLGKYKIAVDTTVLDNGDSIAAYLTSASGTLFTNTTNGAKEALDTYGADVYAEDSAHASGDIGSFSLAVRNDTEGSLVSANGDYAPLQVDSLGRLRVNADISINNDFVFAEDSAASGGALGASILSVRQDTLATDTSADGDYSFVKATSLGEVYVYDASANSSLDAIQTELENLSYAEDSAHASGDMGIMGLAVRNDTPGSLVSADGDYAPLQVDATGNLRVTGTITISGQYAEDTAASSGDIGLFTLGVRRDTTGTSTSASGDYSEIQTWSNGELKVVDISNSAILQAGVTVTSTAASLVTAMANRKSLMIQNVGSASIWIGSSSVTTSGATRGIEIIKGSFMELEVGPAVAVYGIVASTSVAAAVLQMS
jgi:hypothetical protein